MSRRRLLEGSEEPRSPGAAQSPEELSAAASVLLQQEALRRAGHESWDRTEGGERAR